MQTETKQDGKDSARVMMRDVQKALNAAGISTTMHQHAAALQIPDGRWLRLTDDHRGYKAPTPNKAETDALLQIRGRHTLNGFEKDLVEQILRRFGHKA